MGSMCRSIRCIEFRKVLLGYWLAAIDLNCHFVEEAWVPVPLLARMCLMATSRVEFEAFISRNSTRLF